VDSLKKERGKDKEAVGCLRGWIRRTVVNLVRVEL
jgi:hypothetical protein